MMKLHWSPRSPFVRKVMITLEETGLTDQVDCTRNVVAVQRPTPQVVLDDNPLGKIPTLATEEGQALFDSRVICEYLDAKTQAGLFPSEFEARMAHLRWQALADGLTDIILIWRTERLRPSGPWQAVTDAWQTKVRHSMATLESEVDAIGTMSFGIGHIAIICALGQLDGRWPDCNWRDHFPNLSAWEAEMAKRPSVQKTARQEEQTAEEAAVTAGALTF